MSLSMRDCLWNETRFDKLIYWPGLESSCSDWSCCSLCRLTAACAWVRSCSNISGFDCCICSPNCWALVRQKKLKTFINSKQHYRKIPKISPSKYKPPNPVQIYAPRGLVLGKLPSNTKQNKAKTVNLLPTIRLAQSILKRKFPSVDKPLRI